MILVIFTTIKASFIWLITLNRVSFICTLQLTRICTVTVSPFGGFVKFYLVMCSLVATIFTTWNTFLLQLPSQHLSSPIRQIFSPNLSTFYLTPQFDPLFMRFLAPICKTDSASLRTLPHLFLKMPCVLCVSCLLRSRLFALAHLCLVNFKTLKSATFEALKLYKSQFECKGTQNLQF